MIVPYPVEKATASNTTPSGGIGQDDFPGLANFSGLREKSGRDDVAR
jgi:hypothetical protein